MEDVGFFANRNFSGLSGKSPLSELHENQWLQSA